MRILIGHSRYLSGAASGENAVVDDEAKLLKEAGHDVALYTPEPAPGMIGAARSGVDAVWSRNAVARLGRLIAAFRPEIVHFHNLFPSLSPAALRAAAGDGRAVLMTLHNYRLMCLPATLLRDGKLCEDCVGRVPWPGVIHRCYRGSVAGSAALASSLVLHRRLRSFERVTIFVAISDFVRNKHCEAGVDPARMVVKPHFAWPIEPSAGDASYFIYVGRLSPEKGVDVLIKAWEGVPADLVVVGDGPEGARLRSIAGDRVRFTGTVEPSGIPRLLTGARAIVVPSICHEGAGKVVLEAYAAGVPAIVSEAGGLPEAVEEGVTGYLVKPGDPVALREAALRMLRRNDRELGRRAYELWDREYSPKRGLERLQAVYSTALARVR